MSNRHRFHGDPARFDVVAEFVAERFPAARYVADVAGGQGMLARILAKRYGMECEVIDPRGWTLKGVAGRAEEYSADFADYYDLIVGLHPDEALRPVVESARVRPTLLVPCCNFWDRTKKLSQVDLGDAIREFHESLGGSCEPIELGFRGPKNRGMILQPPQPA